MGEMLERTVTPQDGREEDWLGNVFKSEK